MKLVLPSLVLVAGLVLISDNTVTAEADTGTAAIIYYVPTGTTKEKSISGTIKSETAAGIKIVEGKTETLIPSLGIVQVAYATRDIPKATDFRSYFGSLDRLAKTDPKRDAVLRKELLDKALAGYQELGPKVRDNPLAYRYTQYRIADIYYRMAQDDHSLRPKAIEALEEYRKAHPDGWEILPTLKVLARIYEEDRNLEKALSVRTQLADLPGAPDDLRQRADLELSQMLLRNKKYPDAAKRLSSLLTRLKPSHPLYAQTQVQLVLCDIAQNKTSGAEKQLHEAIKASTDPTLRAMAYNALGDLYRLEKKPDDAFWAYLRVDTLYNADDNEQAKALYYLAELFKETKFADAAGRAENCRERLKDKRYAETEYGKLAAPK